MVVANTIGHEEDKAKLVTKTIPQVCVCVCVFGKQKRKRKPCALLTFFFFFHSPYLSPFSLYFEQIVKVVACALDGTIYSSRNWNPKGAW